MKYWRFLAAGPDENAAACTLPISISLDHKDLMDLELTLQW